MSISALPAELLSRIFTIGADEEFTGLDISERLQALKPGQQFPKAFTCTVAPVCRRWHALTHARMNAHLWAVVAAIKIGGNTFGVRDPCVALVEFKDLLDRTEHGRRDLYVQLWSSIRTGPITGYRHDLQLFIAAITIMMPHQRRLSLLDILLWNEDYLDIFTEITLHRLPNCPRLQTMKLRAWAYRARAPFIDDFPSIERLYLPSNDSSPLPLSLATFMYESRQPSRVFQHLKDIVATPYLRYIDMPRAVEHFTWTELLTLLEKCPNLEGFKLGFRTTSGIPKELDKGILMSLKLKEVDLSASHNITFAFLRILSIPLLEKLSIDILHYPDKDLKFEAIGSALPLPSLRMFSYSSDRLHDDIEDEKFVASLACFPHLQHLELSFPFRTLPDPNTNNVSDLSSLSTASLQIDFIHRVRTLTTRFHYVNLQLVEELEFAISMTDVDFSQGNEQEVTSPIHLARLRSLKIRASAGTMVQRFLWTVAQFQSPCLETASCMAYGVSDTEFARLSFVSPLAETSAQPSYPQLESMVLRLNSHGGLHFGANEGASGPLDHEAFSHLKTLDVKLVSDAYSVSRREPTFEVLRSLIGIGLQRAPQKNPLPALEKFRVVLIGERSQQAQLFPAAQQLMRELESERRRMGAKSTEFILEMEVDC